MTGHTPEEFAAAFDQMSELTDDLTDRQIAAAAVNHLWRSGPVEDAHSDGLIHDEEMFVLKVTLTLAVERCIAAGDTWPATAAAVWRGVGSALPGRGRDQLLGRHREPARRYLLDAAGQLDFAVESFGPGADRARLGVDHLLFTHGLFGGTEYPDQVARFAAAHPVFSAVAHDLEHAPHTLPLATLRDVLDAGLGYA